MGFRAQAQYLWRLGFPYPATCGILVPRPGIEPLHRQADSHPLYHQESPPWFNYSCKTPFSIPTIWVDRSFGGHPATHQSLL